MEPVVHDRVIPPQEKGRARRYAGIFAGAFVRTIAVAAGLTGVFIFFAVATEWNQKSSCNVSVRTLYGTLLTYGYEGDSTDSGALVRALEDDEADETIAAIVLDIDSLGGLPVAGEEVANQLLRMTKPTVAVIRSAGTSAAYWAATGADHIIASPSSDIGSIGVIVEFPDESEKNKKEGIVVNEFTSGVFKNLGTPNRPVTPEEKKLLDRDIAAILDEFMSAVATARHLTREEVQKIADGSTMLGRQAKEAGLVDAIGSFAEARGYLAGVIDEEPILCEPDLSSVFAY
jgi:protease-4